MTLKKPTIILSIIHEFLKPFYLYQKILIWTWGKIANASLTTQTYFISAHKFVQCHSSTILLLLHGHCQYLHSNYWRPCGCCVSVYEWQRFVPVDAYERNSPGAQRSGNDYHQSDWSCARWHSLLGGKLSVLVGVIACIFWMPKFKWILPFLQPGKVYFDMAILQVAKLLVDESSLTGEVYLIAKRPLDLTNSHLT